MNLKKIEEVIRLMEKHNLSEISVEEEGVKVHLKKELYGAVEKTIQMTSPVLTPKHEASPPPLKEEKTNLVEIKAPMVGTFYNASAPDSKPFVDVGSSVSQGDVLCIIEAMKLMNEIKSEVKGKIADILIGNGEPIEFGQVLFLVEPS
ncbi:MAG: acetyl-CoA carboxylase biotin carboxyl carrier protein [Candidatus Omnitrophica bacterium]|nr:acetyl-CoA carboxylase biotin carboxyl carrier protein [Candidatus Omnitrophota bacterium]